MYRLLLALIRNPCLSPRTDLERVSLFDRAWPRRKVMLHPTERLLILSGPTAPPTQHTSSPPPLEPSRRQPFLHVHLSPETFFDSPHHRSLQRLSLSRKVSSQPLFSPAQTTPLSTVSSALPASLATARALLRPPRPRCATSQGALAFRAVVCRQRVHG